jgi:hypothetical protein
VVPAGFAEVLIAPAAIMASDAGVRSACDATSPEVTIHHMLEEYLDSYIKAAGISTEPKSPLFRASNGKTKILSDLSTLREESQHLVMLAAGALRRLREEGRAGQLQKLGVQCADVGHRAYAARSNKGRKSGYSTKDMLKPVVLRHSPRASPPARDGHARQRPAAFPQPPDKLSKPVP